MKKIDITNEIERKININRTEQTIFYYFGRRIGNEINDGKDYSINMRNGFSLKTVDSKSFPPKYRIIIDSNKA